MAETYFNMVVQAGALVIVAWVIFMLFTKTLPQMMETRTKESLAFLEALKDQRADFQASLTAVIDRTEQIANDAHAKSKETFANVTHALTELADKVEKE